MSRSSRDGSSPSSSIEDRGRADKGPFDEAADARHLRLDDSPIVDSEEARAGPVLDYNADNQIVGLNPCA
jgi:hypothetical protein